MVPDQESPPTDSSANNGSVALLFMGMCTVIGIGLTTQVTNDVGTMIHWFWVGVGLAAIHLLTIITNNLEELREGY